MFQPSTMTRSARFDPTGQYRYLLERQWGDAPRLAIVMLNPSRADGRVDDPTVRRCMGLAQGWGFGAIAVVNLFAYRSPHPRLLRQVPNPVGPENDAVLGEVAAQAGNILLAWGNGGSLGERDRAVLRLLAPHRARLYCLGRNATGQPRHPLYAPRHVPLTPWEVH
jgi:hypothetical protein